MTTFDLFAFGTILFCIVLSAMRGLMGEVFSFVGWLVALAIARFFGGGCVQFYVFLHAAARVGGGVRVCGDLFAARLALAFTHQCLIW